MHEQPDADALQRRLLRVLLREPAPDTNGLWLAHCLDCDLVVRGRDLEDAKSNVRTSLQSLIERALKAGRIEELWSTPAPDVYWDMFGVWLGAAAKRRSDEFESILDVDKVTIQVNAIFRKAKKGASAQDLPAATTSVADQYIKLLFAGPEKSSST